MVKNGSEPGSSALATDRSAETRSRILEAALREFSSLGLAGARMDQIAGSAGVNKALLYYHFESKENLYLAAVEMISGKIRDRSMAVFLREDSAGERLLRAALDHFDRILAQGEFQSLMQQEMMRVHQGDSDALPVLVKRVFAPLQSMYQSMMREGIASGELIDVDWLQIHLAALGANVFYFLAAPVWRLLMPFEPFAPEVLKARRRAVVEFLGQAVFMDRAHGAKLAARVLEDTPMPELPNTRHFFGRSNERTK
jgi:TetR/AcrR family transcriptional regulator